MRISTATPSPGELREPGTRSGVGGLSVVDEANALRDADQANALRADLEQLARSDPGAFRAALEASLGERLDAADIERLLADIGNGEVDGPAVRFVDARTLGGDAYGAYSSEGGGTIYLDRRLQGDTATLERVYAEEFAHHLDARIGGGDARGDEGALFSRTLYEGTLDGETRSALKSEDDSGLVVIDGRRILVEFFGESGQVGHPGGGSAPATPPSSPPPPSPPPPSPPPPSGGGQGRSGGRSGGDLGGDNDARPARAGHPAGGSALAEPPPAAASEGTTPDLSGDSEPEPETLQRGDDFVGIDVDLTVFGGGEFTVGFVYDKDTPRESGFFVTSGTAGGGNVGIGVTAGGTLGDIEGASSGIDVNTPFAGVGFSVGRGEDGEIYSAASFGLGLGLSSNESYTTTWAPFKRD